MLEPLSNNDWTPARAAHLLGRAAFGGTPKDVLRLHAMGLDRAVDSLLDAPDDADLFPPPEGLKPVDPEALKRSLRGTDEEKQAALRMLRKESREQIVNLRSWWLNRMRWGTAPAREKAVLFWHGHWATSVEKVKIPYAIWQQNETFRRLSMGDFEPLAQAVSQDPAMIRYLDLQQSKRGQPNENFAREVMELFTLGEGHYSEQDIREAARAFTGYRIDPSTMQFRFAPWQHDEGMKEFFGFEGAFSGEDIVAMLSANPQCSRFIARKTWTFYAAENPPEPLVGELARQYRASGMIFRQLLGLIFRSREFHAETVMRSQIKGPIQWLVQACKELEIPLPDQMEGILRDLGQVPFAPPNVKGWDGGKSWISSATLLRRYNMAGNLVKTQTLDVDAILPGNLAPERAGQIIGQRLFGGSLPEPLRDQFSAFLQTHPNGKAARRDLIHLMMSTPYYQLT